MRIHSGRLKGRQLPAARGARPIGGRLKVSLFSVITPYLQGARVLDLCTGVGGMGLEALSRGAKEVVLVDKDPKTCQALRTWIKKVDPRGGARVMRGDAASGVLPEGPFDVVLLDPPFGVWQGPEAAKMIARAVQRCGPEGFVACKLPAKTDCPEDPRWEVIRRTAVASAAYALIAPAEVSPEEANAGGDDQAGVGGGRIEE